MCRGRRGQRQTLEPSAWGVPSVDPVDLSSPGHKALSPSVHHAAPPQKLHTVPLIPQRYPFFIFPDLPLNLGGLILSYNLLFFGMMSLSCKGASKYSELNSPVSTSTSSPDSDAWATDAMRNLQKSKSFVKFRYQWMQAISRYRRVILNPNRPKKWSQSNLTMLNTYYSQRRPAREKWW